MGKKEEIEKIVDELFSFLGLNVSARVEVEDDAYHVSLDASESSALLIGYHGETLNSLQTIISLLAFRKLGELTNLIVDVNGYRKDRAEKLRGLALRTCDKARFLNAAQELPPMNAFERRQIHLFVSEVSDMKSESTGEGRERRVVISPKSDNGS